MKPEEQQPFDINGPGIPGNLFGLPYNEETARLVIVPVPWEATVSYRVGTVKGPRAILEASRQIDLFHMDIPDAWKWGVTMAEIPDALEETSQKLRLLVERCHERSEEAGPLIEKVNEGCGNLNIYVRNMVNRYLAAGKVVGLVGGDHSTPLGLIRALAEKHDRFGILQIDAHADLRKSYEGFLYSHGSIMYNALKIPAVNQLVQVGIRDLCEAEHELIRRGGARIHTFFDSEMKRSMDAGKSWAELCAEIIKPLPKKVYLSLDIDGLDPRFCPNTGTPVPGGLDFFEAVELIRAVATSGRTIIGFDLNEVAPGPSDDWDANVGARLLWQMSCWTGVSQGLLKTSREGR